MRTKLSLFPFYCFSFFPESVKETTRTKIMQIFWCLKLLFQQKGTDHKMLLVSCSINSFLTWVSETNQAVFFKIWSDIWMLKIVEIFQQKGTDHKTLLIVSCSIYLFLIWVSETIQIVFFKGATKSYFTHYMLVVIILFITGLYEFTISTYSFAKLLFLCFIWFSVYSVFWILMSLLQNFITFI